MNWISKIRIGGIGALELSLILVALTIPFSYNLNSYAIVLFTVLSFFSNSLEEKVKNLQAYRRASVIPILYFTWIGIRLLWDKPDSYSVEYLESQLSLVVFPVFVGSMNKLSGKAIRWILYSFVVSNIAGSLYCLWRAIGEYQERKYFGVFFYHHLSSHIGLNAIYFSMYCVFCIFILVYYFLTMKMSFWTRILSIASIVYLLIIVVLLSSKMFIFIFCLSALVIAFYSYRYFRRIQPGLAVLFLLLFAVPILSTKFTFVSSRIMETKLQEYRGTIDDQNGLAVRGVLWKSSWKLIVQRPLLGWGRIGGQEELRKLVGEAGFQEGAKKNYNSHNQYLYTWLCYGLPGILLFVAMLATYLVAFIRKKQFFGIYLVSSFTLAICTESMMETQRGIVFFFLFTTIFLHHFLPQRTSKVLAG